MKTKLAAVTVCIMLAAAGSLILFWSDADAESECSAAVAVSNLRNEAVRDLFDNGGTRDCVREFVCGSVSDALCLSHDTMSSLSNVFSEYDGLCYEAGRRSVVGDDMRNINIEFYSVSLRFTLILRNGTPSPLSIVDAGSGYSGEGVDRMFDAYGSRLLDVGGTIAIEGWLSVTFSHAYTGSLFENDAGSLYAKDCLDVIRKKCSHDLTVRIGTGSAFSDTLEYMGTHVFDTRYDIVNGSEASYSPDTWQMRTDSIVTDIESSGTKTFDGIAYPYKCAVDHSEQSTGRQRHEGALPGAYVMDCGYCSLKMLDGHQDEQSIAGKVSGYGGMASHESSRFAELHGGIDAVLKTKAVIRFFVRDPGCGRVDTEVAVVERGAAIITDGNTVVIGGRMVTAYPGEASESCVFSFKGWSVQSGAIADDDMTVYAEFQSKSTDYAVCCLSALLALLAVAVLSMLHEIRREKYRILARKHQPFDRRLVYGKPAI